MNANQVIDGAIAAIERLGWTQRVMYKEGCGVCLIGALFVGAGANEKQLYTASTYECAGYSAAYDAVRKHLMTIGEHIGTLSWWNDAQGRTKDQVIAALKGAKIPT